MAVNSWKVGVHIKGDMACVAVAQRRDENGRETWAVRHVFPSSMDTLARKLRELVQDTNSRPAGPTQLRTNRAGRWVGDVLGIAPEQAKPDTARVREQLECGDIVAGGDLSPLEKAGTWRVTPVLPLRFTAEELTAYAGRDGGFLAALSLATVPEGVQSRELADPLPGHTTNAKPRYKPDPNAPKGGWPIDPETGRPMVLTLNG